jgi:malonyl-CoA/methylmalonyl-CoA synthetase
MTNPLYDNLIGKHATNEACFLRQPGRPTVSFRQFSERTGQVANLLLKHGLKPGDRVAVQASKTIEMVILYGATIQAGGVFLPLNTDYQEEEISYFINDACPKIFVCDSQKLRDLNSITNQVDSKILTLDQDGQGSLHSQANLLSKKFTTVDRKPNDLVALLYTSGTTGRSKGAMLTQNNLLSNAIALKNLWKVNEEDTLIHALPIFHTHGLFVALNTALLAGSQVNFITKFKIDEIIQAMNSSTLLMGVPTFYTRLLEEGQLTNKQAQNMRLFISGSAPLLAETHKEFNDRTGHKILERYGMTETNMISSNPYYGERRPGTVGTPLSDVEIIITDPTTGKMKEFGETGMIEVRGPNVFKGYWNMPSKTALELRENGFFITGDLGQFSSDGYLTIVGRQKDLIISGGYNIYPKEIEDILNRIDQISETAVVGIADKDLGERVVAAVILEEKGCFDEKKVRLFIKDKLARYKHPSEYVILKNLPRNSMGKVQKNLLRKNLSEKKI